MWEHRDGISWSRFGRETNYPKRSVSRAPSARNLRFDFRIGGLRGYKQRGKVHLSSDHEKRERETEIEVNFIANRIREELRGRGRSAPNEIFNRLRDRIFNQFREGRKIERSYRTDPWILFEAIGVQISDPISDQDGLASEKSYAAPVWINDEFWMKIVREKWSRDQLKRVLFSRNQWDIWDFKIVKFKFQSSFKFELSC